MLGAAPVIVALSTFACKQCFWLQQWRSYFGSFCFDHELCGSDRWLSAANAGTAAIASIRADAPSETPSLPGPATQHQSPATHRYSWLFSPDAGSISVSFKRSPICFLTNKTVCVGIGFFNVETHCLWQRLSLQASSWNPVTPTTPPSGVFFC